MIWKFLRQTSSAISAIAENTKDQLKEQRYRNLTDARSVVAPPQPEPVETKDKGIVADVIGFAVDKIVPKSKPKPDVTEGRSFVPGQILTEEESDWLAAWHVNEKVIRQPGYDLRMTLGYSKSGPEWEYLKIHDPSFAGHLLTMAAQLHSSDHTDATMIKQKMDERIAQLKRHHRVLSE